MNKTIFIEELEIEIICVVLPYFSNHFIEEVIFFEGVE